VGSDKNVIVGGDENESSSKRISPQVEPTDDYNQRQNDVKMLMGKKKKKANQRQISPHLEFGPEIVDYCSVNPVNFEILKPYSLCFQLVLLLLLKLLS
jgi:hypothetical protein